jgi:Zn-dependent protease
MELESIVSMSATVLPPEPAPPSVIHSCPSCSHWLPDGTLACPDCQALTYGQYLAGVAAQAQALEQEQKWVEARDLWHSALQWLPQDTRQAASVQQHVAQLDARIAATEGQKAKWQKRLGPFAPVALFLIKAKSWFFMIFKLKFLLYGLMSFGWYFLWLGWRLALLFMATMFLHEMGHYVAVKRRGLKADLPMFMPGFGAYVRWYNSGVSREDLASISLAGPFAGLLAALVSYAIFRQTHSQLFLVLTYLTAWVNFINLFPIRFLGLSLDGSQAVYALSKLQRGLVAVICILLFAVSAQGAIGSDLVGPNVVWSFLVVGLGMAWKCFANDAPEKAGTKSFAYFQMLILALGFLVLIAPLPAVAR